jgi:hypothetical protein
MEWTSSSKSNICALAELPADAVIQKGLRMTSGGPSFLLSIFPAAQGRLPAHPGYLLMSSFASRRFNNGCRKGLVASGAPLMACVISLAAAVKSPVFESTRANAR